MGLFTRAKPATREEIIACCGRLMRQRADSLEAQQLAVTSQQQFGMSPAEVLTKFFDTQWEVVVRECGQQLGKRVSPEQIRATYTDMRAIDLAVRTAGQALYPGHGGTTLEVLARMRAVADQAGWPLD